MIIHIAGSSGVGKTALGKRLKSRFRQAVVIDTDDVYDDYMQRGLLIGKGVLKSLLAKHKGKDVIVVGIALTGANDPKHFADEAYFIKLPRDHYETIFIQRLTRDISNICRHKRELIPTPANMYKLGEAASLCGIRQSVSFDYAAFEKEEIKWARAYLRSHKGYVQASPDSIVKQLDSLLQRGHAS